MKKTFGVIALAALVLLALMLYRANTVFQGQQIAAATGLTEVRLDQEAAIQRFSQALTFPTISHDNRDQFEAAAFLGFHDFLQSAYPLVNEHATRTIVNNYSLVYHLPGTDPTLEPVLFMSHMDVVPIEENTRDEWTFPPFAGSVHDEIIWGRGSVDDKIGVIALMEAMEILLTENKKPARSLYFAFGHDEEVGGKEGAAKIADYFEEQGIRFDFVLDEGGALTEGLIMGIEQAVAVIGVSEKGYVNLRLTVNAPGGHSSQPPAQTAVGILSRAIVKIEDHPFPANLDPVIQTIEAIGDQLPFSTRLAMSNLWLLSPLVRKQMLSDKDDAAGIRTTTAATMVSGSPKANILPTRATAVVNFRILPGETVDSVRKRVSELIDDERVIINAEYGNNPSPISPTDSRAYHLIASTIRAMDETVLVAPYMVRGGTDAKYFYALSDHVYRFLMVRINPETMNYVHGIDERMPVQDFLQAIRFYHHMIKRAGTADSDSGAETGV